MTCSSGLFAAIAAFRTAVASHPRPTCGAVFTIMRRVGRTIEQTAIGCRKFENRFAVIVAQSGLVGLIALEPF